MKKKKLVKMVWLITKSAYAGTTISYVTYEWLLRKSCHLRGLNVKEQDQAVMLKYLTEWLAVTSKLDYTSMSMLLHLPILLGYNHGSRIWDKWSVH